MTRGGKSTDRYRLLNLEEESEEPAYTIYIATTPGQFTVEIFSLQYNDFFLSVSLSILGLYKYLLFRKRYFDSIARLSYITNGFSFLGFQELPGSMSLDSVNEKVT